MLQYTIKVCRECKQSKSISCFHQRKSAPDGLKEICKDCVKVHTQNYYQKNKAILNQKTLMWQVKNPEKTKEYNRKHRANNREKYSKYNIAQRRKQHGFTEELFAYLMKLQGNKCAICTVKLSTGLNETAACADHNHATNKPRGILCKRCNLMLGHARDDVTVLAKAIEYLYIWTRTS